MFTFSNLLKRGANYLLLVVLARSFSVSEIGIYSTYMNVVALLVLITNFGFSEFLLVNSGSKKELKNNTTIFIQLSLYMLMLILFLSFFMPLKKSELYFFLLIKVFFETSVYNILLAHYQVLKKIKTISIFNILSGVSLVIICFICYFLNKSINTYLILIDVIYLLIFSYLFYFIKTKLKPFKVIFSFIKEKYSSLKYYGLAMITVPVYMMAPTVIGSLLLKPEVIANYQVAFSISNILLLVSVSLLQVGYANFIEYQNDLRKLRIELKNTGIKIILINVLVFIFFLVFGKDVLLLVYKKEQYLNSYYPLILLLIGNIIFMFASLTAVLMVVLKMQKEKAKYHLEFIVISIVFGFILTYFCGLYGLVVSYLVLYSYASFKYAKKFINIYSLEK